MSGFISALSVVGSILIMLLILTVLVVVHEWGHYIAARIFGVKVNEFAIFMGPKIYSRKGKKTGTVFSVRCLPLGGFCAMEGEETTEETDTSFSNKPWWQRTIILLAGVFMNIVLALVIMTVIFVINGYTTRRVSYVSEYMPVSLIGLEVNDRIVEYNGYSIYNQLDYNLATYVDGIGDSEITIKKENGSKETYAFSRIVDESAKNVNVTVFRIDGKTKTHVGDYTAKWDKGLLDIEMLYDDQSKITYLFSLQSEESTVFDAVKTSYDASGNQISREEGLFRDEESQSRIRGYSPTQYGYSFTYKKGNIFETVGNAFMYNVSLVKSVFSSLKWLITGRIGMDAMSGPIGLTTVVKDVVTADTTIGIRIGALIEMAALISANLAAFNVLPIPGLDGGKLIFVVIELIRRGKKVPPEKEAVVSLIFLALLILFSIFVAGNDILRIIRT